jgi:uncharacterized protein YegL
MCDGGKQSKSRGVNPEAPPKRGDGSCPPNGEESFLEQECNMQQCIGDEVCVETMDVVLLIDGSGSLTQRGFEVLQNYTIEIVKKLKANSYGHEAMRVGIVQFGNGHLGSDNVVSDAMIVQMFEPDMNKTQKNIKEMKWQKGFTNMAQGIMKSQSLLSKYGRKNAAGTVVMITDGKPSFLLQTNQSIEKLKETSTLMIVQVKVNPTPNDIELMTDWASHPVSDNYLLIEGKKKLKEDMSHFAVEALVKMCPLAESPSSIAKENAVRKFQKTKENKFCPDPAAIPRFELILAPEDCKAYADKLYEDGWAMFTFGPGYRRGEFQCQVYKEPCSKEYEDREGWQTYEKYDAAIEPIAQAPTMPGPGPR